MKTKLCILFYLSLFTWNIQAQEYQYYPIVSNDNVVWSYCDAVKLEADKYDLNYSQLRFDGDTIINEISYKKLYLYNCGTTGDYMVAMREVEKKVYIVEKNTSEELLVYNFDLNEGDIFESPLTSSTYQVTKVEMVEINGKLRKKFSFDENYDIWIEGIGSLAHRYLPYPLTAIPLYELGLFLNYQKVNDEITYKTDEFYFNENEYLKKSYPQIGAKWYNSWISMDGHQAYFEVEVAKDTIILDKNCFEMAVKRYDVDNKVTFTEYRYVLYEEDHVYEFHNDNFHILYDFTKQVGDIIKTTLAIDEAHFVDVELEVTEVSTVEINGEILRTYNASVIQETPPEPGCSMPSFCTNFGSVIENVIGAFFFPVFDYTCGGSDDGSLPDDFRCYINGDFYYKSTGKDCEYTFNPTSIDENKADGIYSLQTSPDGRILTLSGIPQYPVACIITDMNGSIVLNSKLVDNTINISQLQPGVYILQIQDASRYSYRFIRK